MYLDRVKITIKSGNGGDGSKSFYRSKLSANGGPDGGDGGKGGDVVFVATNNQSTLQAFQFKKKFVAGNGGNGLKKFKTGANGEDIVIEVPLGTVIYNEDNKVIADLTEDNQRFIALKGGQGGWGNTHYANSVRQAPKFAQTGEITKERQVILELKTIADVGIIGYPNAGKSTLLSVISNAKPKIANYQFTTLFPNLGVVQYFDDSFVVADIPGLIEGASEGMGLGHYFLKHIERVRLLIHLVDVSSSDGRDPVTDYFKINEELKKYSEKLSNLQQIVVLSKIDALDNETLNEKIKEFEKQTKTKPLIISSVTHTNIKELVDKVYNTLKTIPKPAPIDIEVYDFDTKDKTSVVVESEGEGIFRVSGGYIDHIARGVVLNDSLSFAYFQKRLVQDGIIQKLLDSGMKDGDIVRIKDVEFEYNI